jgi:hypothetical protein
MSFDAGFDWQVFNLFSLSTLNYQLSVLVTRLSRRSPAIAGRRRVTGHFFFFPSS